MIDDISPGFQKVFKPGSWVLKKPDCSRSSTLRAVCMVDVPCINVGDGALLFTFDD
jgi:hypothetical protein